MKRVTLLVGITVGLSSNLLYAAESAVQKITLTGHDLASSAINGIDFDLTYFTQNKSKDGTLETLSQDNFKFERGYDDGYVGPAASFDSKSILTCSIPATRITSLADFDSFPSSENPFPIYGLSEFNKQKVIAEKTGIDHVGLRLYQDKSVMNFSGLQNLTQADAKQELDAIRAQFGQPTFVLKRNNGIRAIYLDEKSDAQAIQLAYENALNPEKKNNLLAMAPSTVLYGVLLDASLNSEMNINIQGEALEFYIGSEYLIFTKYHDTGQFIDRFNTVLEKCDSTAI
ncbi:hypothetical protein [Vibrio renipiscarius]|uniref:Uncharacterized protein n=1 Tax=Vibrio renipiscarius TaxID=1461322 RepID=A0A0C2K090_9VIBR|nr:hypothetical protein [Vibrio renipiscarius]KII75343.1 hypothetical protein OJ16_18825 [Vibrio renipiscarius]KII78795.1 hypothetical protein PL18_10935 [Vibrio renipiscarius]